MNLIFQFMKGLDKMYILSLYLVWVLVTYLLGLLFGLDFHSFNELNFYFLGLLSILLGFIISIFVQLNILSIVGRLRMGTKLDSKFNHQFANSFLNLGTHLLRVKVKVTGRENIPKKENFVLVSNHQENYDIVILKPIFKNHPINFIAKESLMKAPYIGRWIGILGNIPISRYADRSAAESIVKGIRQVRNGMSMGIFPEGRRSFGNELIDFKPGALKLAMKPKADVLIVTLYNFCNVLKNYPFKKQKLYVHIHELMKYEEYEGLSSQELSSKVKSIIQKQLDKFTEMYH